jgi:hypothetical protein
MKISLKSEVVNYFCSNTINPAVEIERLGVGKAGNGCNFFK